MKPPKKESGSRKEAASPIADGTSSTETGWRKHIDPHPAALVFHKHTTDEDRKKISDDLKENQRLQARIVTAHVADESGGKTYIVDGITRLDEMEALGWQIVDEHGNWIGQLEGMVDHRRNYTHEQVRQLVISLNANRRHKTKEQIADSIIEVLDLERKSAKGVSPNQVRETSPQGGRPRDEFKTEAVKRGAAAGISKKTVEKSLAKQPDRPKITKPTRREQPEKKKPFDDQVWHKWLLWMKQWKPEKVREVRALVHGWTAPGAKAGEAKKKGSAMV